MKKLLILLFGTIVGLPAISQTDVGYLYTMPSTPLHDSLAFPYELTKRGITTWKSLPVKLRRVIDTKLKMGLSEVYTPESDIGAANVAGSSIRVLLYQTIITADITAQEKEMLADFITKLEGPGTYVPPVTPTEPPPPTRIYIDSVDDRDARTKYSAGWQKFNNTMYYKKTAQFVLITGSTMSLTFTGHKIEWIAERRINHGIAAVSIVRNDGPNSTTPIITNKMVDLYNARTTNIQERVFVKDSLPDATYTITVRMTGDKNRLASQNNIIHDCFVVTGLNPPPSGGPNPEAPSIPYIPEIPTGELKHVYPGNSLKNIVELSSPGTKVLIHPGTYNTPMIHVPVGVSIECESGVIVIGTNTGSSLLERDGVINLKSGSRMPGNQYIKGCAIDGKNYSNAGIIIENRNNVTVSDVDIGNTNFTGVWVTHCTDTRITNSEFKNCAWSSGSYLSGAINLFMTTNTTIDYNLFFSNRDNKGTGIEALWKKERINNVDIENTLTNLKILHNKFDLSHQNPWANGTSKNFSIELHDTHYAGIEIAYNEFQNEVSLASHRRGTGPKTLFHHNFGNLEGDTYGIEMVLDDLDAYDNDFENASMFAANFQENTKWRNLIFRNNKLRNPAPAVSWGGVFLIGPLGVENMRIEGGQYPTDRPMIKYMRVNGGVTITQ